MILDESEFSYCLRDIPKCADKWDMYLKWAEENNTKICYSFGNLYFKDKDIAIMFRLRFGL